MQKIYLKNEIFFEIIKYEALKIVILRITEFFRTPLWPPSAGS